MRLPTGRPASASQPPTTGGATSGLKREASVSANDQLDLDGAGPLYEQIKRAIAKKVVSGAWAPGARIPTELSLVEDLGASRMTINRALRELVAEKLLTRVRGAGTFVSAPQPQSAILEIRDLKRDIEKRGHAHSAEVLSFETRKADEEDAIELGVEPGTPLAHLLCLHRENGKAIQLEDRYVNLEAAPGFDRQDYSQQTAASYLLTNAPYSEAEHIIEAAAADGETAKRLEIAHGAPCLVLHRRTWFHGTPITVVRFTHPGESFRLGGHFTPKR